VHEPDASFFACRLHFDDDARLLLSTNCTALKEFGFPSYMTSIGQSRFLLLQRFDLHGDFERHGRSANMPLKAAARWQKCIYRITSKGSKTTSSAYAPRFPFSISLRVVPDHYWFRVQRLDRSAIREVQVEANPSFLPDFGANHRRGMQRRV
jgi:hypothetical protein